MKFGRAAQLPTYSLKAQHDMDMLLTLHENYALAIKVDQIGELPPVVVQFVQKAASDGAQGRRMGELVAMYTNGSLQEKHAVSYGMLMGALAHESKVERGVSMQNMPLEAGAVDFLLGAGLWGKGCVKYISANLFGGHEVQLSTLRRKIPQILNLPKGTTIEVVAPDDCDMRRTADTMVVTFRRGPSPLIHVCMDPTKLGKRLQFDRRRGVVVGGSGSQARLVVEKGTAKAFVEQMGGVVCADQANLLAAAPQVSGFSVLEMAVWPERHARKGLSNEEKASLDPAATQDSVFALADRAIVQLHESGCRVMAFGADGGVHGKVSAL